MAKRILFTIFILSCITLFTFVPIMIYLIGHIEENMIDVVYLDILAIMWSCGLVLAIFWRWNK